MSLALLLLLLGQDGPKPPPDPAAQQASLKVVREVFKEEYSKKLPADRASFARKLLKQAEETKEDPSSRFVLLIEARDIAAEAGIPDLSMQAVDLLSREFRVDAPAIRIATLATLEKNAKSLEDLKAVASYRLRLAEDCLGADDFDGAAAALGSASALARKVKDFGLVSRADILGKEALARKAKFASIKKAQDTLRERPEDPQASTVVGKYICFTKGDWDGGLALLAKGSDEALKILAEKELAKPTTATDKLSLADGWWQIGDKEKDSEDALRRHALQWYFQAAPQLTGLARSRVEKRLLDGRLELIAKGSWVELSDPKMFGQPGKPGDSIKLKSTGDNPASAEYAIVTPCDGFSARVRFDSTEVSRQVQIEYVEGTLTHCVILVPTSFWSLSGADLKQANVDFTSKCDEKDERIITVIASGGSFAVYLDGEEKGRHSSSSGGLSRIKLTAGKGAISFDQVRLHKKE